MDDQKPDTIPAPPTPRVSFVGTPEALGDLFAALSAAQGEFSPIVKDSQATVAMKAGGSYKFDYAGLDVVIAATQPALSKHGLAFLQLLTEDEVHTVLAKGGARIESVIAFQGCANAQEFGSKVTYLKRYARLSILSVFPEAEDDDANASVGNTASIQRPRASATPPVVKPAESKPTGYEGPTDETKERIRELAKGVGFKNTELQDFSIKHGCGPLDKLNQAKADVLVKMLESQANPQVTT